MKKRTIIHINGERIDSIYVETYYSLLKLLFYLQEEGFSWYGEEKPLSFIPDLPVIINFDNSEMTFSKPTRSNKLKYFHAMSAEDFLKFILQDELSRAEYFLSKIPIIYYNLNFLTQIKKLFDMRKAKLFQIDLNSFCFSGGSIVEKIPEQLWFSYLIKRGSALLIAPSKKHFSENFLDDDSEPIFPCPDHSYSLKSFNDIQMIKIGDKGVWPINSCNVMILSNQTTGHDILLYYFRKGKNIILTLVRESSIFHIKPLKNPKRVHLDFTS